VGFTVGTGVGISVGAHEKEQPSSFSFKEGHTQLLTSATSSLVGSARKETSVASTKAHCSAIALINWVCLSAAERSIAVASISRNTCTVRGYVAAYTATKIARTVEVLAKL
jgi:hypothetical protein